MKQFVPLTSQDELWLARPVPRYTSYPPAPAFHEGVGEADYRSSVQALAEEAAVSLYIHIPFCKKLCLYCGCHTFATNRDDRVHNYVQSLIAEMTIIAATLPHRQKISHLHFGGGSPNILGTALTEKLFDVLHRTFDFSTCREAAMELDPRLVTREQATLLASCGVSRVSLGVQDLNPEVQKVIGRIQPDTVVESALDCLRGAGIRRINFDLMYGLPLQTPESLEKTARAALVLRPDRVSFFSYAHVPQLKPHQKALEAFALPDKYALIEQEAAGRAVWQDHGYVPVGMDHYAAPEDGLAKAALDNRLHRNFQGYTDDIAHSLLGFGASSIGEQGGVFFQNEKDVELYAASIARGALPIVRGYASTAEDRCRAEVIEILMCYLSCDVSEVAVRHGFAPDFFDPDCEKLTPLVEGGLVARDGGRLALLSQRRMAIRVVCGAFDTFTGKRNNVASRAA